MTTRRESDVSLWLADRAGRGAVEIRRPEPANFRAADDTAITWAGEKIVYTSTTAIGTTLYAITPAGDGAVELAKGGWHPTASPDGQTLVFVQRSPEGRITLVKTSNNGRNPVVLVPNLVGQPHVTRDGKNVLFSSTRSGVQSVWAVPIGGGAPRRISDLLVGAYSIAESPDGKWLAFSTIERDVWKIVLCKMPACTEPNSVLHPGAPAGRLRWTPEGNGLGYLEPSQENVWVKPLHGSEPYRLTQFSDGRIIGDYAWSADGTRLALARVSTRSDVVMFRDIKSVGKR